MRAYPQQEPSVVVSGLPMNLLFGPNPIPSPIEVYPAESNGEGGTTGTSLPYFQQRRSEYAHQPAWVATTPWPGYSSIG